MLYGAELLISVTFLAEYERSTRDRDGHTLAWQTLHGDAHTLAWQTLHGARAARRGIQSPWFTNSRTVFFKIILSVSSAGVWPRYGTCLG